MSDNTEQPGGGAAPRDPWAPPDSTRVDLGKQGGQTEPPAAHPRPAVHDQPTVTSMPSAGQGDGTGPIPQAGGLGPGPSDVPPPPIGPNGPGHTGPPPAAHYGYPAPLRAAVRRIPGYGAVTASVRPPARRPTTVWARPPW